MSWASGTLSGSRQRVGTRRRRRCSSRRGRRREWWRTPVGASTRATPRVSTPSRGKQRHCRHRECVVPDGAVEANVRAGARRRQRLVGALAAGHRRERAAGQRFARRGNAGNLRDQVQVDGTEDDDHQAMGYRSDDALDEQDVAEAPRSRRCARWRTRLARARRTRAARGVPSPCRPCPCAVSTRRTRQPAAAPPSGSPVTSIVNTAGVTRVSSGSTVSTASSRAGDRRRGTRSTACALAGGGKIGVDDGDRRRGPSLQARAAGPATAADGYP